MKAKATAFLLADLGVTRSHNRPYTANDNPFSESHFIELAWVILTCPPRRRPTQTAKSPNSLKCTQANSISGRYHCNR